MSKHAAKRRQDETNQRIEMPNAFWIEEIILMKNLLWRAMAQLWRNLTWISSSSSSSILVLFLFLKDIETSLLQDF